MKKISIKSLFFAALSLGLALGLAGVIYAANNVTITSGASIVLPSDSSSYSLGTDTTIQSFTVNNSSIDFIMEASSVVSLTYAGFKRFDVSNNAQCSVSASCGSGASTVSLTCPSDFVQHTVTITPVGTCLSGTGGTVYTPPSTSVAPTTLSVTTTTTTPSVTSTQPITTPKISIKAPDKAPEEKPISCFLTPGLAYKSSKSKSVYYITEKCEKRPFRNPAAFFSYFDSWKEVKTVTKDALSNISNDTLGFTPLGPKYDPKYGALVKIVTDPKVYLLLGTEKYWITDADVFNALNYKWNWIEDIDKTLLDKYQTGSEISYTSHHPNYTLIKYKKSAKVYRLEPDLIDPSKQVKRHVADEKTFNKLNFRWDRIVIIKESEVYSDGARLK